MPGRELVGKPLPISVLPTRSEVAAGDLREIAVEAGVPASLGLVDGAVEIGDLADTGAEAGRADHGAVRAGQATIGHVDPARMIEPVHQSRRQTLSGDALVRHAGAACGDAFGGAGLVPVGGRSRFEQAHQAMALLAAGIDEEPIVQLREHQVIALCHLGTGAHRRAEAGAAGAGALHRDDERLGAPRPEVLVDVRTGGKHLVLDQQGGDLTGAHAEEGKPRRLGLRYLELHRAVLAGRSRQRDAGRLRVPLPALRAHREVEQSRALGMGDPIAAREPAHRSSPRAAPRPIAPRRRRWRHPWRSAR